MKLNYGWLITITAWIASSIIIVLLPELLYGGGIRIPGYMVMEVIMTFGVFALITAVVWIPVGVYTSRVYRNEGLKKSLLVVGATFLSLNLFWLMIFLTIWNS